MKLWFIPFHRFSLVVLLFVLSAHTARTQPAPVPGLEATITQALKDWDVPGLAIAIVADDRIVFERGFGVRELGKREPVDEHTIFSVASTTKAMTVACLGMLVDEGKVSWDDPVTKHLPWFELSDPYVTREMKIRDLLTHRSGLSRGDLLWYGSSYDRKEVIERIRHLRPTWSFRSNYGYQNIMYVTAGEVVAAVSGMSWDAFMKERLFTPLGMIRSSTSVEALKGMPNVATPHEMVKNNVKPVRWPNYDNVGAAGSVNSSAHDMALWLKMNLSRGKVSGTHVVSEKVIDEMQTPFITNRIDSATKALRPMTNFITYGLGWSIQDYYGARLVTHNGWLDGMRTRVAMIPGKNIGVAVLLNGPRAALHDAIVFTVLDHYLGKEKRDWSSILLASVKESEEKARTRRKERDEKRVVGTTPSFALGAYAGTYEHEMYGTAEITLKEGALELAFGPMYVGTLAHRHYETFQVNWKDEVLGWDDVLFVQGFDGKVASFKWSGVGEFEKKGAK